jgi:hypothetical protein
MPRELMTSLAGERSTDAFAAPSTARMALATAIAVVGLAAVTLVAESPDRAPPRVAAAPAP